MRIVHHLKGCGGIKRSFADQSIDDSDNVVPSTPDVDGDVSLVSSGHHDHSVDAREGSVAPERVDVASKRAVPGGLGNHCDRPCGKGLRPGYTIPKHRPHREQTPQGFSKSESEDDDVSSGWSAEHDWDEDFDEVPRGGLRVLNHSHVLPEISHRKSIRTASPWK